MPSSSDQRTKRWPALIAILAAAAVVLTGLTLGLAYPRPASRPGIRLGSPASTKVQSATAVVAPASTVEGQSPSDVPTAIGPQTPKPTIATNTGQPVTPSPVPTRVALAPSPTVKPLLEGPFTYGMSYGGRPLHTYRLGTGVSVRAIIGGIHGGYEKNTVDLVNKMLDHLRQHPDLVPSHVTLYVIPCANPDGLTAGTGLEGRVNGNGVDLNRNWDYHWGPTATHGTRPVKAGEGGAFSEPETAALRDLILGNNRDHREIEAAIFYHSAMGKIFYGAEATKSASEELAVEVSRATGYPVAAGVPGQITTGDAVDWMSDQGLAGIEIELTNHYDIDWERNLNGLRTFLEYPLPKEIGNSVQGRPIEVTQVGDGHQVALAIIGGIHGNEANTQALVQGLQENYVSAPESVPPSFTLYFLPAMNPDGLKAGTRHNARGVDLNRNWPTEDWKADGARTNGIIPGSGGTAPGSEPEVQVVSSWLLDTIKPAVREVWLLSYHSAYPPNGGVQPGYTIHGAPGAEARKLAERVADLSAYTYLPTWPSEHPFTGEFIHWCDINGIWAADVELPNYDSPSTVPSGKTVSTLAAHQRVVKGLLEGLQEATPLPQPYPEGYVEYAVQPGDALSEIALRFNVDVEEIMRLNYIIDEDSILAGTILTIPVPAE